MVGRCSRQVPVERRSRFALGRTQSIYGLLAAPYGWLVAASRPGQNPSSATDTRPGRSSSPTRWQTPSLQDDRVTGFGWGETRVGPEAPPDSIGWPPHRSLAGDAFGSPDKANLGMSWDAPATSPVSGRSPSPTHESRDWGYDTWQRQGGAWHPDATRGFPRQEPLFSSDSAKDLSISRHAPMYPALERGSQIGDRSSLVGSDRPASPLLGAVQDDARVHQLREELSAMHRSAGARDEKIATLEKSLAAATSRCTELEATLQAQGQQLQAGAQRLEAAGAQATAHQTTEAQLRQELSTAHAELAARAAEKNELRSLLDHRESERHRALEQARQDRQRVAELEDVVAKGRERVDELQWEIRARDTAGAELHRQSVAKDAATAELAREALALRHQVQHMESMHASELAALADKPPELDDRAAGLENNVRSLRASAAASDKRVRSLLAELEVVRSAGDEERARASAAQRQIRVLQVQLEELRRMAKQPPADFITVQAAAPVASRSSVSVDQRGSTQRLDVHDRDAYFVGLPAGRETREEAFHRARVDCDRSDTPTSSTRHDGSGSGHSPAPGWARGSPSQHVSPPPSADVRRRAQPL